MMKVLAATGNKGKLREIRAILAGLGIEVVGPGEAGAVLDVEEDGATFSENARKKALAYHRRTGMAVLADDSGLAVDALGGRPGIRSARYAGEKATDEDNWRKLLAELEGIPDGERGAAFVCAVTLIFEDGSELAAEGRVEGSIAHAPKGVNGFGYDPVFLIRGTSITMAEAEDGFKNGISHRAMALRGLARLIGEKRTERRFQKS